MAKELTIDQIGKVDYQPIINAGDDLEAVANGAAPKTSGDGMESASAGMGQTITDNGGEANGVAGGYSYGQAPWGATSTAGNIINLKRIDPKTNNAVDNQDKENGIQNTDGSTRFEGENVQTGDTDNPDAGEYKKDKYLAKGAAFLGEDTAVPAFSELVEKNEAGELVEQLQGTLKNPNILNKLVPNTIFIDNTASEADVIQGNVGDCYFLAALLQVVHNDPAKIVSMIRCMGGNVSTTFYHKEGDQWVPVTINTNASWLIRAGSDGIAYVMGSQARLAYDPVKAGWTSSIENQTLKIDKTRFFEAAFWVNCMEQAYTIFAQTYGRYGQGDSEGLDRISSIDGGYSGYCLQMFYGDNASIASKVQNDELVTDSSNLLSAKREFLVQLLELAQTQGGQKSYDANVMAGTHRATAVNNLYFYLEDAVIPELQTRMQAENASIEELEEARTALKELSDLAWEYIIALPTLNASRETDTPERITNRMDELSIQLQKNSTFQELNLSSYPTLQQRIGTVVAKSQSAPGADDGNMFIYSQHAYNVQSVSFVDQEGKPISSSVDDIIASADITKSTVVMQNPHGTGTPNYHEATTTNHDTGTFTVTLEEYLNNITVMTLARSIPTSKQ